MQTESINNFLQTVKYFTGNPVTTPGIELAFKKLPESYVGVTESTNLSVKKENHRFVVRLSGQTKVDRV